MKLVINGRFLVQRATGVQRVAGEVTRALDRLLGERHYPDLDVRLLAPAGANASALMLRNIAFQATPQGGGNLWEQRVLPKRVGDAMLLCLGNSAPLACLRGNGQVGVMLHDQAHLLFPRDYSRGYRLWHRILDAAILRHARPLFTVSETERATIAARNPHRHAQIVVTPNGSWIDDAAVTVPAPDVAGEQGYVLYVGSFTARKNIGAMFALALHLAQTRGIAFRFVGPPNAASCAFANSIPDALRPLIRFTGFVDNTTLVSLYKGALCLLYPSFYEASGLPPAEAMTWGCPVIASDLPVLRERCGDAALYSAPDNWSGLRAAVLRLIDEPALAATLRTRGRQRAAGFTWRAQAIGIVDGLYAAASQADRAVDAAPGVTPASSRPRILHSA